MRRIAVYLCVSVFYGAYGCQEPLKKARWSDLVSDSDSEEASACSYDSDGAELEHKNSAPAAVSMVGIEFAGIPELEQKLTAVRRARLAGDRHDSPESSYEADYMEQAMQQLTVQRTERTLARLDDISVCAVGEDELHIVAHGRVVYDGAMYGPTHAAIAPTKKQITVVCKSSDGLLQLLTIGVPQVKTIEKDTPAPQERMCALPLVLVNNVKRVISEVGEIVYTAPNKVRITVLGCLEHPCDDLDVES